MVHLHVTLADILQNTIILILQLTITDILQLLCYPKEKLLVDLISPVQGALTCYAKLLLILKAVFFSIFQNILQLL